MNPPDEAVAGLSSLPQNQKIDGPLIPPISAVAEMTQPEIQSEIPFKDFSVWHPDLVNCRPSPLAQPHAIPTRGPRSHGLLGPPACSFQEGH